LNSAVKFAERWSRPFHVTAQAWKNKTPQTEMERERGREREGEGNIEHTRQGWRREGMRRAE